MCKSGVESNEESDWEKRLSDVWKPNKALTRVELSACFTILELEWNSTEESDWEKRLKISNTACLLISGYY